MADIMAKDGYAAVGYEYVNIDDCWLEKERDSDGKLVPDKKRFPHGMKNLSDYVRIWIYQKLTKNKSAFVGRFGIIFNIQSHLISHWAGTLFFILDHFYYCSKIFFLAYLDTFQGT